MVRGRQRGRGRRDDVARPRARTASARIAYDVAILTNLTHEHLELHGTWEAYRDAKLSPVRAARPGAGPAVREPEAASLAGGPGSSTPTTRPPAPFIGVAQEAGARVLTYGTDPSADVRATRDRGGRPTASAIAYDAPSGAATVELRLAGRFNVHNALAVVALGEAVGLDPAAVRDGLGVGRRSSPAGWSGSSSASRSGSSSTTPTARRRSQTVLDLLAPLAAARGRRADRRRSARPASATRRSGR